MIAVLLLNELQRNDPAVWIPWTPAQQPRSDLVVLNEAGLGHPCVRSPAAMATAVQDRVALGETPCSCSILAISGVSFSPVSIQFLVWSPMACQFLAGSRSRVGASHRHPGDAADTLPGVSPLSSQEGDSLGAMEKLCRQLTYHLSPHSQWRRQGIMKRKPQSWWVGFRKPPSPLWVTVPSLVLRATRRLGRAGRGVLHDAFGHDVQTWVPVGATCRTLQRQEEHIHHDEGKCLKPWTAREPGGQNLPNFPQPPKSSVVSKLASVSPMRGCVTRLLHAHPEVFSSFSIFFFSPVTSRL